MAVMAKKLGRPNCVQFARGPHGRGGKTGHRVQLQIGFELDRRLRSPALLVRGCPFPAS